MIVARITVAASFIGITNKSFLDCGGYIPYAILSPFGDIVESVLSDRRRLRGDVSSNSTRVGKLRDRDAPSKHRHSHKSAPKIARRSEGTKSGEEADQTNRHKDCPQSLPVLAQGRAETTALPCVAD